ncbi:hypothetical protein TFKS16_1527 [Tannerella forsythia KS16]|uniref:Uncharacterized protein n=1 Tax=Tannerella forsythia (strain ATCC 43037 / JCM 10827 / CCUG 21028 A / KCTC 5666 / FDC 338) TaxID=203275 RepID=G8UN44_TANFA|nr:hypothetical protein BFO_1730 [Tannerella forsythia 92A2]BAR49094.1 hypothetical protein TF3313_1584 [Tannerella forsythia 3313]BAR51776.1 hypothetical protein TFKS16_1527 [Tannerella forsythia KS16]
MFANKSSHRFCQFHKCKNKQKTLFIRHSALKLDELSFIFALK